MAQSFIDKYVFALMLDSSNFEKGANLATKAANGIKSTLLKTYSIVGGIDLFKNMVTDYTNTARSIDNLNLITGENITTLQAWKKSIQDVGGNVGAFEGTLKGLSQSFANLRQFGQVDERLALLGWQGIDLYKDGRMKKASEVLLDISKRIREMSESDAFSWASKLGIDESTYRLFRLHGENLDDIIRKNERWAVIKQKDINTTRQYDKIVSDFKNSWLVFSREIMSSVLPVLQKDLLPAMKYLTEFLLKSEKGLKGFATGAKMVLEEVARIQVKNEKYGKFGALKTGLDLFEPLFNYTPMAGLLNMAKGKLSGLNQRAMLNKELRAYQNTTLTIQNMEVNTNNPEYFAKGLEYLARRRGPLGLSSMNKLDLDLGPQIIGANSL